MNIQEETKSKILYGYHYFPSNTYPDIDQMSLRYFERLQKAGFEIESFCLSLDRTGKNLSFRELDRKWNCGDTALLSMYERLEERLQGKDILINGPGIHLHPDFVQRLPQTTVFQCFDDPESSSELSRPVATSYDVCLVGNIAEIETYKSWGVKNVAWLPQGIWPEFQDPEMTSEKILQEGRSMDLFLMADRLSPWRRASMNRLLKEFPNGHFFGRGWPRGYLPVGQEVSYLKNSKIGINLHNSTGPVNIRTFYLPANGVLQICDNKSHFGKIFKLGKEAVGFDTIEEALELIRYYLAHETERREIAARGFERAVRDYNQISVFRRALDFIKQHQKKSVEISNERIVFHHREYLGTKPGIVGIFRTLLDNLLNVFRN